MSKQTRVERYRNLPVENHMQMLDNDLDELEREVMEDQEWIRQEFQSSRKVQVYMATGIIMALFGAIITQVLVR